MTTRMRLTVVLIGILLVLATSAQILAQATPTPTSAAEFEITGTVEAFTADTVTIGGQVIQMTQAEVRARIMIGAQLKIHLAIGADGTLIAREVETALDTSADFSADELEIVGTVEAFTADTVTIGGQVIQMTQAEIRARILVGTQLKIHLAVGADGTLIAREVELAQNTNRVVAGVNNAFGTDDGAGHDLNDDHGNDGLGHDVNDDHGNEQHSNSGDEDHGGSDDHGGSEDHGGHGGND